MAETNAAVAAENKAAAAMKAVLAMTNAANKAAVATHGGDAGNCGILTHIRVHAIEMEILVIEGRVKEGESYLETGPSGWDM